MRPYRHVALGGTFDRLHLGHDALLRAALAAGDEVSIGLTSDGYLASHPKAGGVPLLPYPVRARRLGRWLTRHYPARRWEIVPLEDRFGRAVEEGIDALVVSSETRKGGRAVNAERRRRGLAPLPLLEVPLVLADDLLPLSSTRIRAGAIGPRGERLSPIRVGVAADEPDDLPALAAGVRKVFPRAVVLRSSPGRDGRAAGGAESRSRRLAQRAQLRAELAVGAARSRSGGWSLCVRAGRVVLSPRPVRPGGAGALSRGLVRLLRPVHKKPL